MVGNRVALLLVSLLFSFVLIQKTNALTSVHQISFNKTNLLIDNQINLPIPIPVNDSWNATFKNNTDCRLVVGDDKTSLRLEPGNTLVFPIKNNIVSSYTINVSSVPLSGSCAKDVYRSATTVYPASLVEGMSCEGSDGTFIIKTSFANLIPQNSYLYSPSDLSGKHLLNFSKTASNDTIIIKDPGSNQTYSLYNANGVSGDIKVGSVNCISNNKSNKEIVISVAKNNLPKNHKFIYVLIISSFTLLVLLTIFIISMWMIFEKTGLPGIYSIIPIYNFWLLFKIVNMSPWWSLALLIPGMDVIALITLLIAFYKLGKLFGKNILFNIFGMTIFPFIGLLILAFGNSKVHTRR